MRMWNDAGDVWQCQRWVCTFYGETENVSKLIGLWKWNKYGKILVKLKKKFEISFEICKFSWHEKVIEWNFV